jgi:hypothetical protein
VLAALAVVVVAYIALPSLGHTRSTTAYAPLSVPAKATASVPSHGAADTLAAKKALAKLAKQYDGLKGVTVSIGKTPDGSQAVAYYTTGQIVISPTHVAGVEKILAHEVWHVIDWRDNGRLDWGEDLPPRNASDYRRG